MTLSEEEFRDIVRHCKLTDEEASVAKLRAVYGWSDHLISRRLKMRLYEVRGRLDDAARKAAEYVASGPERRAAWERGPGYADLLLRVMRNTAAEYSGTGVVGVNEYTEEPERVLRTPFPNGEFVRAGEALSWNV